MVSSVAVMGSPHGFWFLSTQDYHGLGPLPLFTSIQLAETKGLKTYKNLFPQICSFESLYQAYRRARRGKRDRLAVTNFELNLESELLALQTELRTQTYQPGAYHNFIIHEPKQRLVSAAPFRDRVVHHALCQAIEPIWEASFI